MSVTIRFPLKPASMSAIVLVFGAMMSSAPAMAQTQGGPSVWTSPSGLAQLQALADQMREITRLGARSAIEHSVDRTTNGEYRVTSRDRTGGPLASRAHDRGAVDVVTSRTGGAGRMEDARRLSAGLGPSYSVVVEQPYRVAPGSYGPSADRHTTFVNGAQGNTRMTAPRATGEHFHIQPNFEVRASGRGRDCVVCGTR